MIVVLLNYFFSHAVIFIFVNNSSNLSLTKTKEIKSKLTGVIDSTVDFVCYPPDLFQIFRSPSRQ